MAGPQFINRRTVLKTIGAGVVGGVGMSGLATADSVVGTDVTDGTISLEGLDFAPDRASVDLSTGSATVTWEHNDTSGAGFIHNVAIYHNSRRIVKSRPLNLRETYEVMFVDNDDTLTVEETGDNGQSRTFSWSGSLDLHVHCDLHSPEMEMERFHVFC